MKFPIRYIPLAALLLPAGLAAQTQQPDTALTRTVVVEQEYAPLRTRPRPAMSVWATATWAIWTSMPTTSSASPTATAWA